MKTFTNIMAILILLLINVNAKSQIDGWPLKGLNINLQGSKINEKDINTIYRSGMHLIVLNLKPKSYAKKHKVPVKDAFELLLDDVEIISKIARAKGIKIILAFSEFPLYEKKITKRSPIFWDSQIYINEIYAISEKIAIKFQNNEAILAYKILDEPVVRENGKLAVPKNWIEIQNRIVSSIRKYDKNKYIVVTSGPGGQGSAYEYWKPLSDPKIIYGAHFFSPMFYTHQGIGKHIKRYSYPSIRVNKLFLYFKLYAILNFQKKYNVPIFIGSFSTVLGAEGDLEYLNDLIDIFDENNFSWAYWQYNGFPRWNIGKDINKNGQLEERKLDSTRWKLISKKINERIQHKK